MKQEAQVTIWGTGVRCLKRRRDMLFLAVGADRVLKVSWFSIELLFVMVVLVKAVLAS